MELISQHAKKIMEGCKERARDAGLVFEDESLEYIVSNRDMLELSPKTMIPTLYDYWVQDVEILRETGRYELYPSNPYETVINTRPPISFYNDNNPDWLNVMIFYHVLGHIDFFQNNVFFMHTWDYDFTGKALSDKRLISKLRSEKGRWVDYIIEFSKSIDNLVGYFNVLGGSRDRKAGRKLSAVDYYFDIFLQSEKKISVTNYVKELEKYNGLIKENPEEGESVFLDEVKTRHAEFDSLLRKFREKERPREDLDLMEFLLEHSEVLNKEENRWMASVLEVIRGTSLYFQPQIRTKILNEGWASYWHEQLFMADDRIDGHEVDFAIVNARVMAMPRVGLNPYALGMMLFSYLEVMADKGRVSIEYQRTRDRHKRKTFDSGAGAGRDFIFHVRKNYCDSMFVSEFIDQEFVDRNKLFVAGRRLERRRMIWQYYVKSRKAKEYKNMVLESLYHPPAVQIGVTSDNHLYLNHQFEGKPLVRDYIFATMLGIEFLWGKPVILDTSEPLRIKSSSDTGPTNRETPEQEIAWKRIRYTMKDRKLSREELS